jgi:hypothetical protein
MAAGDPANREWQWVVHGVGEAVDIERTTAASTAGLEVAGDAA